MNVKSLGLEELSVQETKEVNGGSLIVALCITVGAIVLGVGTGLGIAYLTRY